MGKCIVCEGVADGKICPDCAKLTHYERLKIIRLADVGFWLKEIDDRLQEIRNR